jgi:nucleoside-diphosphate kinase
MATERTLAIIKPDAFARGLTGDIVKRIEAAGLKLRAMRLVRLGRAQAEAFYEVHRERPFYGSLCEYMSSGPVVVMALEADGAIVKWRELMGATDPAKAAAGTIRKDFGMDVEKNATHGSDAPETAAREIAFFFSTLDLAS